MTTTASSLRSPGMRDLLPAEMSRFRRVERAFREELLAWGYEEIRTPTIERLHLFTSAGTLAPQLLDRVYSFLDWDGWSGERVVLRPDTTIAAARVFAEHLAGRVAKLFYVQNIFRFAREDEPRELWQCGAELYGDTWPAGDVELMIAGLRVLDRLGLAGVRLELSHTGVLRALLARAGLTPEEQLERYDRLLAGDLSVAGEIEERLPDLRAPLHLLFDLEGETPSYLANLRHTFLGAAPEMASALDELERVSDAIAPLGVPLTIRMLLARDFEYYTGPVFQFRADGAVLGGGGRYDDLVHRAAGESVPACGFALHVDRILPLLADLAVERAPVVLVSPTVPSGAGVGLALSVAAELQRAGFCAELVGSRRGPDCRWILSVEPAGGPRRYDLHDLQTDTHLPAASMAAVIGALGRGRC